MFALLLPLAAQADLPPAPIPSVVAAAPDAAGFVPQGWRLEMQSSGDLNADGRADLAVLLRGDDPALRLARNMCDDPFDTNPRILVIALAAPGGGYRRVVANSRLIPRRENPCEVDWIEDGALGIGRGGVSLHLSRMMSMGGWAAGTTRFTFRWRDNALRLIGWDYSYVARNSGETAGISINYLTRKVRTETGRIDEDQGKVSWSTLAPAPLPTIDEIGDGLEFDPGKRIEKLP
ncbi:hypothetical protein AB2M62_17245 [Sphingomonas sp. MMS12-HWE2-04]|uniref:hypothetical protein n=1 Tax=Sphingomonas sp. MMS12-HWE2-04 TaxID=3234199 RepID=UPI0038509B06